jgi:hypothetical protein
VISSDSFVTDATRPFSYDKSERLSRGVVSRQPIKSAQIASKINAFFMTNSLASECTAMKKMLSDPVTTTARHKSDART